MTVSVVSIVFLSVPTFSLSCHFYSVLPLIVTSGALLSTPEHIDFELGFPNPLSFICLFLEDSENRFYMTELLLISEKKFLWNWDVAQW